MKKYFLFAVIAIVSIVLVSCENGLSQGKNPYPYLRLSDIAPLHLISVSKAEILLPDMGFKNDDVSDRHVYFSQDKLEYITCDVNADGLIENIGYVSLKNAALTDAKKWLAHFPENAKLPNYSKSIPFYHGNYFGGESVVGLDSYVNYLNKINDFTIGELEVYWYADDCEYQVVMLYGNIEETSVQVAIHRKK